MAVSSIVPSLRSFIDNGLLSSDGGVRLRIALLKSALSQRETLDDFRTLASIVGSFPEHIPESVLAEIRADFALFADEYSQECELNDPDEIREATVRLESVGESLGVETDEAQRRLRDVADDIEAEGGGRPEPDDEEWRVASATDYFTDVELDSMFGTLRNEA